MPVINNRSNLAGTANVSNRAMVGVISENAQTIVQTPIKVVSNETFNLNERPERIRRLAFDNQATIERVSGVGNVIIQIPILVIDELNLSQLNSVERMLQTTIFVNESTVNSVGGERNVIIQIPVLVVNDLYLGTLIAIPSINNVNGVQISNAAKTSVIRGDTNIVFQVPVQYSVDVQQLIND